MKSRISAIVPLLVITICCVALVEGGYLFFEHALLRPAMQASAGAVGLKHAGPAQENEVLVKKIDHQVIVSRNLFGAVPQGKNSQAPLQEYLAGLEMTNLGVVLMGTIGDDKGGNRAIIFDTKTQKQHVYKAGQEIHGAVIKEILRGKVVLTAGGRNEIMDMSEAAKLRPLYTSGVVEQVADAQEGAAVRSKERDITPDESLRQKTELQPEKAEEVTAKRIVLPQIIRPPRAETSN